MSTCYSGQFLKSRSDPAPVDGRTEILGDLKKLHRAGPSVPMTLAKRDRHARIDTDAAIRKMTLTDADRMLHSNADAALVAIRKAISMPPQSLNGRDIPASAGRAGAVSDNSGYMAGGWPTSAKGPSARAAISPRTARPQDTDAGKGKSRRDEDEDSYDRSDITLKAIRRALRPENARKEF